MAGSHPAVHRARTQRARPAARHPRGRTIPDTRLLLAGADRPAAQEPGTATRNAHGACLSRVPRRVARTVLRGPGPQQCAPATRRSGPGARAGSRRWPRRPGRSRPRTDAAVLELAAGLKREKPGRTAAQVRPDPAGHLRLVPVGAHPAAALRAAGAHHPPGRAPAGGLRPVRGGPAERAVDRRRAARPAGRPAARRTCSPSSMTIRRAVMAARWGYFEDSVRLAAALRPALAARGVPGSGLRRQRLRFCRCGAEAGRGPAGHQDHPQRARAARREG